MPSMYPVMHGAGSSTEKLGHDLNLLYLNDQPQT